MNSAVSIERMRKPYSLGNTGMRSFETHQMIAKKKNAIRKTVIQNSKEHHQIIE